MSSTSHFRASAPRLSSVLFLALGLAGTSVATAGAETFRGEYTVSFLGLTVARSSMESRIVDGRFEINGTMASAGIATLFDQTRGTASATGRIARQAPQPGAYEVKYSEGSKHKRTAVRFRDGAVASTVNEPEPMKRGEDWVPVAKGQLTNVLDPLSAGMVKASGPGEVCGRTLQIYDGEFLLAATLHAVEPKRAIRGYGDEAVTCRVSVKPVAGYRKGRKALDYLENRSRILVAFAPLGATGLYAPVHATVGTQLGTVTVSSRAAAD
jgi:hypothetical protein